MREFAQAVFLVALHFSLVERAVWFNGSDEAILLSIKEEAFDQGVSELNPTNASLDQFADTVINHSISVNHIPSDFAL